MSENFFDLIPHNENWFIRFATRGWIELDLY